jgi:hypothetical protein
MASLGRMVTEYAQRLPNTSINALPGIKRAAEHGDISAIM